MQRKLVVLLVIALLLNLIIATAVWSQGDDEPLVSPVAVQEFSIYPLEREDPHYTVYSLVRDDPRYAIYSLEREDPMYTVYSLERSDPAYTLYPLTPSDPGYTIYQMPAVGEDFATQSESELPVVGEDQGG